MKNVQNIQPETMLKQINEVQEDQRYIATVLETMDEDLLKNTMEICEEAGFGNILKVMAVPFDHENTYYMLFACKGELPFFIAG